MSEPRYLTVRETAKRLECHENTVRNWCDDGTITGIWRRGESGFRRIPESEVQRLLAERPGVPRSTVREGRARRIKAAKRAIKEAEGELRAAVQAAHDAGDSWSMIGKALGISRQAAHERFGG